MKKVTTLVALPILFFCNAVFAQSHDPGPYRKPFIFGLMGGVNRSIIEGLESTLISEPFFLNYTLEPKERIGGSGAIFFNCRFDETPLLGIQLELGYAYQASDLVFNNMATDFNYHIKFNYQYINIAPMVKIYPLNYEFNASGINVGVGAQLGFNIAPSDIKYTSGGTGRLPAFGTDLEQQQQLRNVLKGKNNMGVLFCAGYEFQKLPLIVDVRYHMGLADVVETQPNAYNFIENKNVNNYWQFTVSCYLRTKPYQ